MDAAEGFHEQHLALKIKKQYPREYKMNVANRKSSPRSICNHKIEPLKNVYFGEEEEAVEEGVQGCED